MESWMLDGAALIDALLSCESAEDAHDLIVNHVEELADLARRLRQKGDPA